MLAVNIRRRCLTPVSCQGGRGFDWILHRGAGRLPLSPTGGARKTHRLTESLSPVVAAPCFRSSPGSPSELLVMDALTPTSVLIALHSMC
jgi:hypothetical protein